MYADFSENKRAVILKVRLNVLLKVILWFVTVWRWCFKTSHSESIIGLAKRVTGLVLKSGDALFFACKVDVCEVAGWCRQLFLFLQMENKHVIFWSTRVTVSPMVQTKAGLNVIV